MQNDTLRTAFLQFLRQSEIERGLSIRTIIGYKDTLNLFFKFTKQDDCPVAYFTTEILRVFFYYGKEERQWAARTYHIHHNNLSVFSHWLMLNNFLTKNPLLPIQKPKLSKPLMKALKDEEVHKILYVALLKSSVVPFLKLRNHALIMLPLHSGLRMSEVISLHIADIDIEAKSIHVRNGKGAKDRVVIITDELVSMLTQYIQAHQKYFQMKTMLLFPSKSGAQLNTREFRRITDKLGKLAGVKFSSHDLRRTYATTLSRNKVSPFVIQNQLGHSDIRVTMRYVCHDLIETEKIMNGVILY
jgi:site-specific recombinase XerD